MVYVDAHQIWVSVQLNPSIKLCYVSRFHNHITQVCLPRAGRTVLWQQVNAAFFLFQPMETQYFYFLKPCFCTVHSPKEKLGRKLKKYLKKNFVCLLILRSFYQIEKMDAL